MAWRCEDENRTSYIVKAANNGQDRACGSRLKVVTTELICGRLGNLIDPAVCPLVAVVDIPSALAETVTYPGSTDHPTPGAAFGSRYLQGRDTKVGGQVGLITSAQGARLTVFQTWLCAEDAVALLPDDDSPAISVDHGYYLTGSQWDDARLEQLPTSIIRLGVVPAAAVSTEDLEAAVTELEAIPELVVVRSCSQIPETWGADLQFRVKLAAHIVARRDLTRPAILYDRRN
jgi:hypothetical protein